jgi:hypothetical protein
MHRRWILGSMIGVAAACASKPAPTIKFTACVAPEQGLVWTTFHGSNDRMGWNAVESTLTPTTVGSSAFGLAWSSPPFDTVTLSGKVYSGRAYGSPLYADGMPIEAGAYAGQTFDVLFAATTSGVVYAVNAFDTPCAPQKVAAGTVLWKASIATPAIVHGLDGGLPLGVLSTPVLDLAAHRLYVAAMDAGNGAPVWRVYALDARSGALVAGYPVTLNASAIEPVNTNGPCSWEPDATQFSQRSALALAPAGDRLYVTFAGYNDTVAGWMIAIDTAAARVAASFSVGRSSPLGQANGGMWGAGGPAITDAGVVFTTTGNGPSGYGPAGVPNTWGDSLLAWSSGLALTGTYSPWNFCLSDANDADVGGNSTQLLPDLSSTGTSTPRLVAFGSKQGNVYLLERDTLPGSLTVRQSCSATETWQSAATDTSLLPPAGPPYCDPTNAADCVAGPLNVFGPYSDSPGTNEDNSAKMRSTPAFFTGASGANVLYVAGSTKAANGPTSIAPSLVRLRVNTPAGAPAYLTVDAASADAVLINPGSPVVSSQASAGPVVWVVDENAQRTQSLAAGNAPHPVLYGFDGTTMHLLYKSGATDLDVGGKYVEPVVAHGVVFVATDRIQAFGAH